MALFLVRHGSALSPDIDPERGLSKKGISEVECIAAAASRSGAQVSLIQHSTKKRARQTAEILASELNPADGVEESVGLNPNDDVHQVARDLKGADNLMLVGHLPFMARLASYLITGSQDTPVVEFQTGGIVCIEHQSYTDIHVIKWALMPGNV